MEKNTSEYLEDKYSKNFPWGNVIDPASRAIVKVHVSAIYAYTETILQLLFSSYAILRLLN